jgi:hypothetical protein
MLETAKGAVPMKLTTVLVFACEARKRACGMGLKFRWPAAELDGWLDVLHVFENEPS